MVGDGQTLWWPVGTPLLACVPTLSGGRCCSWLTPASLAGGSCLNQRCWEGDGEMPPQKFRGANHAPALPVGQAEKGETSAATSLLSSFLPCPALL